MSWKKKNAWYVEENMNERRMDWRKNRDFVGKGKRFVGKGSKDGRLKVVLEPDI